MVLNIINAKVPGCDGLQSIEIRGECIASVRPMTASDEMKEAIDVAGNWLSLGGVDVQINGALGLAFPEITVQHGSVLKKIGRFLWEAGIDGYLPTLVTTSLENFSRSMSVLAEFMASQPPLGESAQVLGVHLEGPFLNWEKRGAHPEEFLLPLTVENVRRVLGEFGDIVNVMTLAPELDESGTSIEMLRDLGIVVSLGHSLATEQQANQAFDRGATTITHAFNAMPGLHHRQPGLLGAAIVREGVRCGFIADGQHVSPTMLRVLLNAAQFDRGTFLVSDALAPLGLPDGVYPWDTRQIEVIDGTARLSDGTLAGTTRSLLDGVLNLVEWGICNIEQAIRLATVSPRQSIDLPSDFVGRSVRQLLRWQQQDGRWTWQRLPLTLR
ncbi:MAG: N-acetylglucosamine-6-phosphate deacetylase [Cyanobacteria bacterium SID2]|nr:N-acetylglucosamine-6-phosphate deacetylase [Cyanobacteria bacterium SID2]MBP0002315.1 N-acetylglucosamine-6-phosphate deacetylase [Cyanobacteria bacterium SBC]